MLMLSHLKLDPFSLIEVRKSYSLLCVSQRIHLAMMKLDGLISCIKGCPDRWSWHAPSKLKSGKNSLSCLVGESECVCMRIPCL